MAKRFFILILTFALVVGIGIMPNEAQSTQDSDERELRQMVLAHPRATDSIITEIEIAGEWARGAVVQTRNGAFVPGEGLVFIARRDGATWDIEFEGTPAFRQLLLDIPDTLLSPEMKERLDYESANRLLSPQTSGYKLPWPAGISYYVTRAWASGSCNHGSQAVDFAMPLGSRIVAARSGIVHAVVDYNTACGCSSSNPGNYIAIRHDPDDGLYDYYVHIGQGSATVSVGQRVSQGQTIAYSNQIGYTCGSGSCPPGTCSVNCNPGPHLHFHVQNGSGVRQYITFDDVGAITGCNWYTSGNSGGCCGCGTRVSGSTNSAKARSPNQVSWDSWFNLLESDAAAKSCTEQLTAPLPVLTPIASDRPTAIPSSVAPASDGTQPVLELGSFDPTPAPRYRTPVEPQRTPPASASYRIPKSVFGSSGGPRTSTHYVLNATQGQSTDLSHRESASYVLVPGYWSSTAAESYPVYLPLVIRDR